MSRYVFKMPDLGEGTVTAEVVEWKVKVGDSVTEDQVIAEVMTDKAAVEIPSPVTGRVVSITGQPGEMVAVGAELIAFDTSGTAPAEPATAAGPRPPARCAEATGGRCRDGACRRPREPGSWHRPRRGARHTVRASTLLRSPAPGRAGASPPRTSSR